MIVSALQRKVLVIDDELGPRESLRILLKKEYEVHCADSVLRGLELLKEHQPDLVIMDIRMPGMSGIDGLREIRALDPLVAVIMLTGFGALETAQEALRLGASDYLKKPFDTKEILEVIRQNIRRTEVNRKRVHTEHELQELNSRLVAELAKKDRMASLGQASAELVHDLRNPLTVVLGYVQILSEDLSKARETHSGQGESNVEYIDIIEKSIQRCRDLIDTWQDLGRKSQRQPQPVNPARILAELVKSQRPLVAARRVALDLGVQDEECQVLGDATQLTRAIQNIVGNAIEALHEQGGRVEIRGERRENQYAVVVKDDGVGISPENLAHVFEPYFTTKSGKKGTGLGLFITRKIVEDHRGHIDVGSHSGEGTSVTIWLPLWQDAQCGT
jgi:signal transduction histidine kinase